MTDTSLSEASIYSEGPPDYVLPAAIIIIIRPWCHGPVPPTHGGCIPLFSSEETKTTVTLLVIKLSDAFKRPSSQFPAYYPS